jgi:hypothetical protein
LFLFEKEGQIGLKKARKRVTIKQCTFPKAPFPKTLSMFISLAPKVMVCFLLPPAPMVDSSVLRERKGTRDSKKYLAFGGTSMDVQKLLVSSGAKTKQALLMVKNSISWKQTRIF